MKADSGHTWWRGFFQPLIEQGGGWVEEQADRLTASLLIGNAVWAVLNVETFDLLINFVSSIRSDGRKRDPQTDEQECGETRPELRTGSQGLRICF